METNLEQRLGKLTIRRAQLGDKPILRELRVEALCDAPDAFGSTYG
jgi:hypothetical protein